MLIKKEILHTEEFKKKYCFAEREIKRCLTEILLLNNMGQSNDICRGLSITKNFQIRELSKEENPKFISNPSTIKNLTIKETVNNTRRYLFKKIEEKVKDYEIAEKYKEGVANFLSDISKENLKKLKNLYNNAPKFYTYLAQTRHEDIKKKSVKKQTTKILHNKPGEEAIKTENVKIQMAKILYSKFGENAFNIQENGTVVLSERSIDYIFSIFFNANKVRESWGKRVDQVFHDGDFPFITSNIKMSESDYIDAIKYLTDKSEHNYFGKRGKRGQRKWADKKSQYADILRALTNNQLRIDETEFLDKENPYFSRDEISKKLFAFGGGLLKNIIAVHNNSNSEHKITYTGRLKSLPSSVEKIIEGKKINDAIGFRLSLRGINDKNYGEIKQISSDWFKYLKADLHENPEKYIPGYNSKTGQKISIKQVRINNKGVLKAEQVDEIIKHLKKEVNQSGEKIEFIKRKNKKTPYITQEKREKRMIRHYPEIVSKTNKRNTIKGFYKRIIEGVSRGKNGGYKDFKYNITLEIKNKNNESIGERNIELQFDDINNEIGMSNHHIRDFERGINTQSRLSFSIPLGNARKSCEERIKKMRQWIQKLPLSEKEKQDFFKINFENGTSVNISDFSKRYKKNSNTMDIAIVNIINYFLKKGTFILCDNGEPENNITLDRLLTTNDLYNNKLMQNLHICSILELASQQHSYLHSNWNRKVGIYIDDLKKIQRISLGELINPMNLGKIKNSKFSTKI